MGPLAVAHFDQQIALVQFEHRINLPIAIKRIALYFGHNPGVKIAIIAEVRRDAQLYVVLAKTGILEDCSAQRKA